MDSSGIVVSSQTLVRFVIFLLYAPVGLIAYWKLFPSLSPTSKWLATGLLAAQVLVIVLSPLTRSSPTFEAWLWHLDREGNVPSAVASTQLALVSGVALVAAWLARDRPAWRRLYLVGVGMVFLHLAQDEFYIWHEWIRNWRIHYAALGVVVAVTTAVVAVRSPRRSWKWHGCLLAGLAMSAVGAMTLEVQLLICDRWGFFRFAGCLPVYNFEESLEFLGIWLALVAVLGQFSDVAPTPKRYMRSALCAFPVLWILLLMHKPISASLELWVSAQPAPVEFESGVRLDVYHMNGGVPSTGLMHLPGRIDFTGVGLFRSPDRPSQWQLYRQPQ